MAWVERPERLGTGPSKITDLAVVDANVAHPDGSARDLNRVWQTPTNRRLRLNRAPFLASSGVSATDIP